jgi:hypothetical protein
MPTPARNLEQPVEERIARLETHVEHLRSDVKEIKGDLKEVSSDIHRLDRKIDQKFDSLKDSISNFRVWVLTLCIAMAAGLLGVIAKGFGWIN